MSEKVSSILSALVLFGLIVGIPLTGVLLLTPKQKSPKAKNNYPDSHLFI